MTEIGLTSIFLMPLVSLFACWLFDKHLYLRNFVIVSSAVIGFFLVLGLANEAAERGYQQIVLYRFSDSLLISLNYGPLEIIFAGLASFLWPINFIYALGYMHSGKGSDGKFYSFLLLSLFAYLITVFSGDLFTLLFGYEMLTLTTIPLVAYYGEQRAYKQTAIYAAILLGTSLAFLVPAVVWTYWASGTLTFTPGGILEEGSGYLSLLFILFLLGFSKVGTAPFYFWLPAAMVAPTPVSAFLHAVAVVKAGIFGICKISLYVFGLDLLADLNGTTVGLYIAVFTMLYASIKAFFQHNLKRKLAFHTVGNQAYMLAGVCLATPEGLIAGVLHALTHAMSKITLFFSVGIIQIIGNRTDTHAAVGLGKYAPNLFIAYLVAALSFSGLPPFAGFGSKFYLLVASLNIENYLLFTTILICSGLSAGALLPVAYHAFFSPMEISRPSKKPGPAIIPTLTTAICCFLLLLCIATLRDYAANIFKVDNPNLYITEEIVV